MGVEHIPKLTEAVVSMVNINNMDKWDTHPGQTLEMRRIKQEVVRTFHLSSKVKQDQWAHFQVHLIEVHEVLH
jgi:hypothetical protein